MDDLKLPVFLLICILGGVGIYFYNKSQNPVQPKVKPKIVVEETISEEEKAEQKAEADKKNIEEAKKYFSRQDYTKTLDLLSNIDDKSDYAVQRMLAYCYSSKNDYSQAIGYFEKVLKVKRTRSDIYSLAGLYEKKGRYSDASALYFELTEDEEELSEDVKKSVYEGIARVSLSVPDNKKHEEYMLKLLKEWPDSKEALINLIKCKKQNKSYNDIDSLADSGNKYFSGDYTYNYELAQLYEAAGNNEQAVNYYKKCIKIDSKNYTPFFDCYRNLMKLNKTQSAIKALEYYLESGKIDVSIYFEAAKSAHKLKLYRQAFRLYLACASTDSKIQGLDDDGLVSDVEKAVREKGTETEKVFVNAFVCFLNGDYKYAISEIEKIKDELENSIYKNDYKLVLKGCERLANIDKKRDDDIAAYENYLRDQEEAKRKASQKSNSGGNSELRKYSYNDLKERALKNISNFNIQVETAAEVVQRGKFSEAKTYYRNASDINRRSHVPYYELAKIYMIENNSNAAKSNIEQAIKCSPDNVECLSLASNISLKANDTTKAMEYSQSALKIDPGNTSARVVMVKIYMNSGNYDQADAEIDKALATEKTNMKRAELLSYKRQIKELKAKN